jgi:hypothetical protein
VNGKQLQKMIEVAVRKEIQESLPGLIREVLTEVFLRRVVSESVSAPDAPRLSEAVRPAPRKRSREEILRMVVDDDDDGPSIPPTYVSPYPAARPTNPALAADNPMRSLYEDVSLDEEGGPDDVDLSMLFDASRVKRITEEVGRRATANVSDAAASAARSRKIAESMKVG